MTVLVASLAGAGLGIVVTARLHAGGGFWAVRVAGTRFRRANLPVGGVLALAAAVVFAGAAAELLAAAVTMGEAAIAGRYLDPLPPRRAWAASRSLH